MLSITLMLIVSYLLGSLSCAIIVCKLSRQPDPCKEGSLNPGATNVLRLAGKKFAILVLLGDMLKGLLAVALGRLFGFDGMMLGTIALVCVLGHVFPLYFRFRGGKGVATYFGALLGLSLSLALAAFVIWLITAVIFRYSSLAALVAIASTFLINFFVNWHFSLPLLLLTILLFWTHRENITRLKTGTESKIKLS